MRGQRSRKPIGFRLWVVHKYYKDERFDILKKRIDSIISHIQDMFEKIRADKNLVINSELSYGGLFELYNSLLNSRNRIQSDLEVLKGNINIAELKSKGNIDIPDEARRIERSRKKKIMGGVAALFIVVLIVGAVAIYVFYIKGSSNEGYIPKNSGKADEGNRRYLDNKPTFTANDRAVLDLIMDLEQISKEVNQK